MGIEQHYSSITFYCIATFFATISDCQNSPFLWVFWQAWNTASWMDSMAKHKWAGLRQEETDLRLTADFFMVAWNLKFTWIYVRNGNRKDVRKRALRSVMTERLLLTETKSSLTMTPTQYKQRYGCYWCKTMGQNHLHTWHENQSLKKKPTKYSCL